jgi:hypothetical protein
MHGLLHSHADEALALRHQEAVCLGQLRLTQSIKRIVEMDFKRAAPGRPLSHAF